MAVVRLQKVLSERGVASRRKAEELIAAGHVKVNGRPAQLGDKVDDRRDVIHVRGKKLGAAPQSVYIALHKPRGYITTMSDERGRKCVEELVRSVGTPVYPVGRLDKDSEGLLLMTNDGALTQRLTHPKGEIQKVYHVWVNGFYEGAEDKMRRSIMIDGRMTVPAGVKRLSGHGQSVMLEFTLFEGRNRQIRRLCENAGVTVTRLKRISEGELQLGNLPVGKWRHLTQEEINSIQNHF